MKYKSLILTIFCLKSVLVYGQLGLDKLGNINDALQSKYGQKALDAFGKELEKSRKDYEDKAFNYAIIVSDNSALFENEQKIKKYSNVIFGGLTDQKSNPNPSAKASSKNSSGEIFFASHKYKWASDLFESAISDYEANGLTDESGYTLAISNLGLLYNTTGRFEKSIETTTKALELRKKKFGEKNAVYAASLNNMAVLLKDMGKYSEATDSLEKAIQVNAETLGKQSLAYAIMLNNKAMLQYALGQYQEAVKNLIPALDIAEKELGKSSFNLIRLKTNLAIIYKEMNKYTESEDILQKCIKTKEKKLGTSHPDYASLLTTLASLYIKMNKMADVEALLTKASSIYKKELGEQHPSYATSLSHLGNFYRSQNNLSKAEELLRKAMEIRLVNLGENHPDYVNSLEDMALLYWAQKNTRKSIDYFDLSIDKSIKFIKEFFPAMSENEKSKLWAKTRPKILKFYAFVNDQKTPDLVTKMYNLQISTKGILLNSTTKVKNSILASKNNQLIKLYEKWLDQKEDLARLYTYSKAELQEEKINLDSLEKETESTEKKLTASSSLFSKTNEETSNKEVAASLKANEAAVEIINFQKYNKFLTDTSVYAAIIIQNGTEPRYIEIKNGHELDKRYYSYYKNAITSKNSDKYAYAKFWGQIDSSLAGKTTVYASLDGIYNLINLNTLKLPNEKYLIDKYNIQYVLNTKFITVKKTTTAKINKTAVLLGNPDYGSLGTIAALPGTKIELDKTNAQLKTNGFKISTFVRGEANETNIKAVKNPYILHIATHGYFQNDAHTPNDEGLSFGVESQRARENPLLRGGLLLANAEKALNNDDTLEIKSADNGIFTAFEAMNLSLDETEIVFLSACETGKGESKAGEGVYGLQRAIQVAGAESVIMSLWKVSDEATQQLISIFYREWLKTGNKNLSLIKAQKELKLKYPEPLFWGAFVLL